MRMLKLPYIVNAFMMAPIGGAYLNISDYGNLVQKLNIEVSPELRWVSGSLVFIYLLSTIYFSKSK
jgi:hypothetical protein